ncbi:hypothetical protein Acsp01_81980 [Actinoplanes sp. NBRC 101535]|nr:hypothetical protein Acsp01_81980 [Actinoplanes sp. NBRC 101535]
MPVGERFEADEGAVEGRAGQDHANSRVVACPAGLPDLVITRSTHPRQGLPASKPGLDAGTRDPPDPTGRGWGVFSAYTRTRF